MAMVPYKGTKQLVRKNKNKRGAWFDPNQLAYDFGLGAVEGMGKLARQAYEGIVSAFRSKGVQPQEIRSIVAPLAKQLSYTSRKPTFIKAKGGIMIEHIEQININGSGHTHYLISSQSFHWLRGIANQFEEYQIQAWYAWNPTCPATTSGQVMMAFDYDPNDPPTAQYLTPADYFNTADHCISAIWAPAAMAPQRSSWLKCGVDGDVRLFSPGRLHFSVTDYTGGFLTVKYQVSLRKPQPATQDGEVIYTGTLVDAANVFNGATLLSGDASLVGSMTPSLLTIASTPGYKFVTWSLDGNIVFNYATGSGGRTGGTRTGTGATYTAVFNPFSTGTVSITPTAAPSTISNWKLTISQSSNNPLAFTWP